MSKCNSALHWSHDWCMAWGSKSSQPIFDSHTRCSRILALMVEGENHPRTSNVLAMSDTSGHVICFLQRSDREAKMVEIGIPFYSECFRVFIRGGDVMCWSRYSGSMWFKTLGSLEFHLRRTLAKRCRSC